MATSTRTRIGRMHKQGRTAPEIAQKLGLSRQRIYSLASKMGVVLAKANRKPSSAACTACGKPLKYPGTTMHANCRSRRSHVTLKCVGCGIRFKRLRSQKRSKRGWHSPECYQKTRSGTSFKNLRRIR